MYSSESLSAQDIRYNLDILAGVREYPSIHFRRKLCSNDINEVALEFIEIFSQQISMLENIPSQQHVAKALNSYLDEVAARVYSILESRDVSNAEVAPDSWEEEFIAPIEEIPLLATELITPIELSKTYNPCQVRDGLEILGDEYAILRVKGDGHCLFRSIGFGILKAYENTEDKETFLINLQELESLMPELKEDLGNVIKFLREHSSPSQLMREQSTSNTIVHFLRRLACAYEKRHSEEFASLILADEHTIEDYIKKMADMKVAKEGGHIELVALSRVLGIKFSIIDVSKQLPSTFFTDVYKVEKELLSKGQHGIALLYRPGHYDYLYY